MKPSAEQPACHRSNCRAWVLKQITASMTRARTPTCQKTPIAAQNAAAPRSNAPSGSGTPRATFYQLAEATRGPQTAEQSKADWKAEPDTHTWERLELLPQRMILGWLNQRTLPDHKRRLRTSTRMRKNTTFDIINKPSPVPNTPSRTRLGNTTRTHCKLGWCGVLRNSSITPTFMQ